MKSTYEPYDDELRERLQHYTEEPDKHLWGGIASRIVSVNPEPGWVIWIHRLSTVTIAGIVIMITLNQPGATKADENKLSIIRQQEEIAKEEKGNLSSNQIREQRLANSNYESKGTADQKTRSAGSYITRKSQMDIRVKVTGPDVISRSGVSDLTMKVSSLYQESVISQKVDSSLEPLLTNKGQSALNIDTSQFVSLMSDESQDLKIEEEQKKNNKEKKQRNRNYTIYFTAMPTFGYQRVESNQTDNIIIESIERIPAFSTSRLGLRVELGIEYPLTKELNFFGGLLYYQRKQTIGYTEKRLDDKTVMPGQDGEVIIEPVFSYLNKSIEYELKNAGLQVGFNYKLSKSNAPAFNSKSEMTSRSAPMPKKGFLHLVGTGIEFHKALNKTSEFNKENGFNNPSAFVFYNFYYRLQYPSEGKLRAILQPTLNYSFYINDNLNAPFYVKPYGLGLNFGCSYSF